MYDEIGGFRMDHWLRGFVSIRIKILSGFEELFFDRHGPKAKVNAYSWEYKNGIFCMSCGNCASDIW